MEANIEVKSSVKSYVYMFSGKRSLLNAKIYKGEEFNYVQDVIYL